MNRFRKAGLITPSLAALMALAMLMGLGTWQYRRAVWKNGLISQIAARTTAPAQAFSQALARYDKGKDVEYVRVELTGRFRNDLEMYVYRPRSEGQGYDVYTPLQRASGDFVLVNRGFVPSRVLQPDTRSKGLVTGDTTLIGLLRIPRQPGYFVPAPEPAKRIFYAADMPAMSAVLKQQGIAKVAPVFVDAEAKPVMPGGWPQGGTTNLKLPNRHMEYAITWFGLAATLIGVYLAFAIGRWRATESGTVSDALD